MRTLGLQIEPHRRTMNTSQPALDEKFKDVDDPLRLVFVCAMWLTGFDAPSCSTVARADTRCRASVQGTVGVSPGRELFMDLQFTAVFRTVPGGYVAFIEEFPGANTQGATLRRSQDQPARRRDPGRGDQPGCSPSRTQQRLM